MGILRYALNGNYKGFIDKLKVVSKKNGKPVGIMFIDAAFSTLLLGSGLQDYLNYEFYNKPFKLRKQYVTIGYAPKAYDILDTDGSCVHIKPNFHKNYQKFTRRDYLDDSYTKEQFEEFLKKHPIFVRKPVSGVGGHDVTKMDVKDIDKEELFKQIQDKEYFLEEMVIQHPDWAKLSPNSTNTIRVMSKVFDDKATIVFAAARIGSGKGIADNFHQGGVAVLVDLETGKLKGKAINKDADILEKSITGITFDGYQVPYWQEIEEMVKEASLVNQDVLHFVGWDVAIMEDGPCLIEANPGPGWDLVQMLLQRGCRDILDGALEDYKKAKKK